jgi:hypothetical protein
MELDKNRIRAILENWSRWARDDPCDPAEVYYYTVCPDFAHIIPSASGLKSYSAEAAELVEDVFRVMYSESPSERQFLIDFYLRDCNANDFAARTGLSKTQLYRVLDFAFATFSGLWESMGGDKYFVP